MFSTPGEYGKDDDAYYRAQRDTPLSDSSRPSVPECAAYDGSNGNSRGSHFQGNAARLLRATQIAALAHAEVGQTRADGAPYIVHPIAVAMVLDGGTQLSPQDEADAMVVAILHDVLEDTKVTYDALVAEFGTKIAQGVRYLTRDARIPKADQKAAQIKTMRTCPHWVRWPKLADRYDNLREMAQGRLPKGWSPEKGLAYVKHAQKLLSAAVSDGVLYYPMEEDLVNEMARRAWSQKYDADKIERVNAHANLITVRLARRINAILKFPPKAPKAPKDDDDGDGNDDDVMTDSKAEEPTVEPIAE